MIKQRVRCLGILLGLVLVAGFVSPVLAHGGSHGSSSDEGQSPANEEVQTPQSDSSSVPTSTASDSGTKDSAAEDPQLTSDIQSTSKTADSIVGLGETVLALLVAAPFLMVWSKQRLQARYFTR